MRRAFLFSIICTAYTLSLCDFSPSARKNAALDYEATSNSLLNKRAGPKVEVFGKTCGLGSFYPLTQILEESNLVCGKIIQSKSPCTPRSPRASPFRTSPKSAKCGVENLHQYQGKIASFGNPSQLYEYPIGSRKFLGKIGV